MAREETERRNMRKQERKREIEGGIMTFSHWYHAVRRTGRMVQGSEKWKTTDEKERGYRQ